MISFGSFGETMKNSLSYTSADKYLTYCLLLTLITASPLPRLICSIVNSETPIQLSLTSIGKIRTPTTSNLCVSVCVYVSVYCGLMNVKYDVPNWKKLLVFRWGNLWCYITQIFFFLANCFVKIRILNIVW